MQHKYELMDNAIFKISHQISTVSNGPEIINNVEKLRT